MQNERLASSDTIPQATAEQRQRGKSMSRRSGQSGTIVREGGWHRVRFRIDVPGQYRRKQMSIKICPVSGPDLLTKSERKRRAAEIVNSHGANSIERFNQVVALEMGQTFREQAKCWLHRCMTRKRRPVKPATIRGWESYLDKHLNPLIGDVPLGSVNNSTMKRVVAHLSEVGLSAKTIRNIVQTLAGVVASAVDENGEETYPRKWNYEFADVPVVDNQHTPMFSGDNVTEIVAEAEGQVRVAFVLFAASGLRAGELFGLEVKHFNGNTLTVKQSVWEGQVQAPKTKNADRQVDLHPSAADRLRAFIGDRKEGFIFRSERGTPLHASNFLRRSLHPILNKLGIEKQGFHGFRRFRVTHLESDGVPSGLVKYWTGHANASDGEVVGSTVTDKYVKMAKDAKFRAAVAERTGLGFDLPKEVIEVVPSVPSSQEVEVSVSV
jgi:integrase